MVFKSFDEPYFDLIVREFLHFYGLKAALKENVIIFYKKDKGQALVRLNKRYSNTKVWASKFSFLTAWAESFLRQRELPRTSL